jgi:hypothetical protein
VGLLEMARCARRHVSGRRSGVGLAKRLERTASFVDDGG